MSDKKVIVVSNSPVVLEKKLGEKIDKFDIIIRINDFEINGYEGMLVQKHIYDPINLNNTEVIQYIE